MTTNAPTGQLDLSTVDEQGIVSADAILKDPITPDDGPVATPIPDGYRNALFYVPAELNDEQVTFVVGLGLKVAANLFNGQSVFLHIDGDENSGAINGSIIPSTEEDNETVKRLMKVIGEARVSAPKTPPVEPSAPNPEPSEAQAA